MDSAADQANQKMVNRMIAEGSLWSRPLIGAFRATPRHSFLDRIFLYHRRRQHWREFVTRDPGKEELRHIYSDRALITRLSTRRRGVSGTPISSSSQPSLMSQMLEDLRLCPGVRVLEVGAGTGYNAALMAHVVGPDLVATVDVDREVLSEAWDHLRKYPERKVRVQHADGRQGLPEWAPFDRLIVTAAAEDLEPSWLEQLTSGGRAVVPLALAPGLAFILCGSVHDRVFRGRLTRAAYFMPLRAEGETGALEAVRPMTLSEMQVVAAPWAGWFERKTARTSWNGFIQAFALFGYLIGMKVHHQPLASGESAYVLEKGEAHCWLRCRDWETNEAGCEQAYQIWRAFLDFGGPRPGDYILTASLDSPSVAPENPQPFIRRGLNCWQHWQLTYPYQRSVEI